MAAAGAFARRVIEASGVDDFEPGEAGMDHEGGLTRYRVRSRSLGVVMGRIPTDELERYAETMGGQELEAFRSYSRTVAAEIILPIARSRIDHLEAKRAAPNRKRAAVSAERRAEALRMHAAGRGIAYIARELGVDRKTVRRYLVG